MGTIRAMQFKGVKEFWHILTPWPTSGTIGKKATQMCLLVLLPQLRDENLYCDRPV